MKISAIPLFLLLLLLFSVSFKKQTLLIAFYNVENLFDTEDDPGTNDNAYLPQSRLQWTDSKYRKKLEGIAKVIDVLDPEVAGLCEVENAKVLKALINHPALKNKSYGFVHQESEDVRGIDVGFIYKKQIFKPLFYQSYSVNRSFENINIVSRDILLVKGLQLGDTIHYLVNHWPSRRSGGAKKSEIKRIAHAMLAREIVDSILSTDPKARILLLGDFNDEPWDESLSIMLLAKRKPDKVDENELINPFFELPGNIGSHKYNKKWYKYDQIIISESLEKNYVKKSASVFHPIWLHYNNNFQNGPFRTYNGNKYQGGYSDHFPVFIELAYYY
ncbi:MAG TPA: hypothetical protein VIK89_01980 [Cytophagaceae bacterium]